MDAYLIISYALTIGAVSFLATAGQKDIADSVLKRPR
jgi:hypothetical protein